MIQIYQSIYDKITTPFWPNNPENETSPIFTLPVFRETSKFVIHHAQHKKRGLKIWFSCNISASSNSNVR